MAQQLLDDTQGNVLGERETFAYTSETGQVYNMVLDNSVGAGVGNPYSTDSTLPGLSASAKRPLRPRYINVQDVATGLIKKRIVICKPDNSFYQGTDTTLTINGTAFVVTSSRGEERIRYQLAVAETP